METSGLGRPPGSHIQPLSCRYDPVRVSPWWFHQSGQRTFPYDPNSLTVWWIHCCPVHSSPVLLKHMSSYTLCTMGTVTCVTVDTSNIVEIYTSVKQSVFLVILHHLLIIWLRLYFIIYQRKHHKCLFLEIVLHCIIVPCIIILICLLCCMSLYMCSCVACFWRVSYSIVWWQILDLWNMCVCVFFFRDTNWQLTELINTINTKIVGFWDVINRVL
jgi:hypothetical protein